MINIYRVFSSIDPATWNLDDPPPHNEKHNYSRNTSAHYANTSNNTTRKLFTIGRSYE